jgi:hypothetical protein
VQEGDEGRGKRIWSLRLVLGGEMMLEAEERERAGYVCSIPEMPREAHDALRW